MKTGLTSTTSEGSVQVSLRAVAEKFEMDGQPNPVITAQGKYHQKSANLLRDTAETTQHQSIN
jgi:hypothetical protein